MLSKLGFAQETAIKASIDIEASRRTGGATDLHFMSGVFAKRDGASTATALEQSLGPVESGRRTPSQQ